MENWRADAVYLNLVEDADFEAALCARFPSVCYRYTYHGTCVSGTKTVTLPVAKPCSRHMGIACLASTIPAGAVVWTHVPCSRCSDDRPIDAHFYPGTTAF